MADSERNDSNTQETKMIPESDLIAYKKGAQSREESLKAELNRVKEDYNTLSSVIESTRSELSSARAEKEKADNAIKELQLVATNFEEIKKQLDAEKQRNEGLTKTLTETTIKSISERFGVPPEKIQDKNLEQLRLFEEAFELAGIKPGKRGTTLDSGNGGGGAAPLSKLEAAKRELELASKGNPKNND